MSLLTAPITAPTKIQSFMDLDAWKKGHELVLLIYQYTKEFPRAELYGLTDQLRRAAVSVTSNIAEGFGRTSYREKAQFYATALGSLMETQNQILIAKDVGYLPLETYNTIATHAVVVSKILTGLVKNTKARIQNS